MVTDLTSVSRETGRIASAIPTGECARNAYRSSIRSTCSARFASGFSPEIRSREIGVGLDQADAHVARAYEDRLEARARPPDAPPWSSS
jgi:hypothetical protein